ncbi:EVE domain-containing protein [Guyparkeria halophila]|uniref:EVE domain-containing protein n=1 Tax=Guyparkeria halophila TaxID=47960 RepID=A0ABZ0Z0M3_9GAMM|nr:EVE domain-containing protein [Guyparkeria halophila]WQH16976.1 EVE domain-containing protein [Guyparkeria halophila]
MAYWLMKSEPDAFSIDDLERVGIEPWDGIRNYQVRNMIRDEMKPGDRAFFYHSNTKVPGIVGIMDIVSEARPDPTAFDPDAKYYDPKSDPDKPRWLLVDVKYVRHTQRVIPLPELKADPALEEMPLVRRGNRLSIMPVTEDQWEHILSLEDPD